jgi:hypothetical protein
MKPVGWWNEKRRINWLDAVLETKEDGWNTPLYTAPQCDGCGNCHACLVGVIENHMPVTSQRMIVCSDCGNKRCPKASNHRHKCTGSNEVGQYGSIYTAPRELSDELPSPVLQEYFEKGYKCAMESLQLSDEEINDIAQQCWVYPEGEQAIFNQHKFAREILKKASEK